MPDDRRVRARPRADRDGDRAPDRPDRRPVWSRTRLGRRVRRLERAAAVGRARPLRGAAAGRLEGRARPAHARRSTRCRSSSARWTSRARSSSPPPRTSCARRSSRSAASSSCSRTRSSTRTPGASSSRRWREQVERLQKLSVDLLDLSRLDAGSVELHTEPVDLAELARVGRRRVPPAARRSTAPSSMLRRARRRARARSATGNGWLRSCVSCSTTPSGTRRRART